MSGTAKARTVSPPAPSARTEMPRRASLRLRVAHALARATVRKLANQARRVDHGGLLSIHLIYYIAGLLDSMAAVLRPPRGTQLRPVPFRDFSAEWVWDRDTDDPHETRDAAIIYFHGGGLIACGLNSHRRIVARIAGAAGVPLLNVAYRQIPLAHVTETVDDCVRAYEYLLDQGFPAERIIVAGDSAGGGLSFSLALAARDRGLPMPGGIAAISPWANYDSTRKRAHPNDARDALLCADAYEVPARFGLAGGGNVDPDWSPVNHDFTGLPPALIQIGSTEVLMADVDELADRCAQANVPATIQIWDKGIHVFHAAADIIPDAREAITEIGAFVRATLGATNTAAHVDGAQLNKTPA